MESFFHSEILLNFCAEEKIHTGTRSSLLHSQQSPVFTVLPSPARSRRHFCQFLGSWFGLVWSLSLWSFFFTEANAKPEAERKTKKVITRQDASQKREGRKRVRELSFWFWLYLEFNCFRMYNFFFSSFYPCFVQY